MHQVLGNAPFPPDFLAGDRLWVPDFVGLVGVASFLFAPVFLGFLGLGRFLGDLSALGDFVGVDGASPLAQDN